MTNIKSYFSSLKVNKSRRLMSNRTTIITQTHNSKVNKAIGRYEATKALNKIN